MTTTLEKRTECAASTKAAKLSFGAAHCSRDTKNRILNTAPTSNQGLARIVAVEKYFLIKLLALLITTAYILYRSCSRGKRPRISVHFAQRNTL